MSINIFLIAVGVLAVCKIVSGYKKGMIREIISLVSLVFLCILVVLAANGLKGYMSGQFLKVTLVVVLAALLGIVHHFLNMIFFPAKLISKLPIIHGVDKLLGIIIGILETILLLWTFYIFVMLIDMGSIGALIRGDIVKSPILTWFYEHNQLVAWVKKLSASLSEQLHLIL